MSLGRFLPNPACTESEYLQIFQKYVYRLVQRETQAPGWLCTTPHQELENEKMQRTGMGEKKRVGPSPQCPWGPAIDCTWKTLRVGRGFQAAGNAHPSSSTILELVVGYFCQRKICCLKQHVLSVSWEGFRNDGTSRRPWLHPSHGHIKPAKTSPVVQEVTKQMEQRIPWRSTGLDKPSGRGGRQWISAVPIHQGVAV